MQLSVLILKAINLTIELDAAVTAGEVAQSEILLKLRGSAMAQFEKCHSEASDTEKLACKSQIQELIEADSKLQAAVNSSLVETRTALQSDMGKFSSSTASSYQTQPQHACVDRKV